MKTSWSALHVPSNKIQPPVAWSLIVITCSDEFYVKFYKKSFFPHVKPQRTGYLGSVIFQPGDIWPHIQNNNKRPAGSKIKEARLWRLKWVYSMLLYVGGLQYKGRQERESCSMQSLCRMAGLALEGSPSNCGPGREKHWLEPCLHGWPGHASRRILRWINPPSAGLYRG